MASVNKCIFIGNLGRDPEIRYMPSGDAMANFSIACTDSFKSQYLKKGSSVYIEGRLQTRKWQNKEGQDQYTTEIVADRMQMLGGRSGNAFEVIDDGGGESSAPQPARQSAPASKPAGGGSGFDDFEDDIPF
jgi:single-strand DNA-binding protein